MINFLNRPNAILLRYCLYTALIFYIFKKFTGYSNSVLYLYMTLLFWTLQLVCLIYYISVLYFFYLNKPNVPLPKYIEWIFYPALKHLRSIANSEHKDLFIRVYVKTTIFLGVFFIFETILNLISMHNIYMEITH